jgi:hypothetical protein
MQPAVSENTDNDYPGKVKRIFGQQNFSILKENNLTGANLKEDCYNLTSSIL